VLCPKFDAQNLYIPFVPHEDKAVLVHSMKAGRGRIGIDPLILNLDTRLTSGPWRFTSGKEARYQLNRMLGGLLNWYSRFGEEKIFYPCCDSNPLA